MAGTKRLCIIKTACIEPLSIRRQPHDGHELRSIYGADPAPNHTYARGFVRVLRRGRRLARSLYNTSADAVVVLQARGRIPLFMLVDARECMQQTRTRGIASKGESFFCPRTPLPTEIVTTDGIVISIVEIALYDSTVKIYHVTFNQRRNIVAPQPCQLRFRMSLKQSTLHENAGTTMCLAARPHWRPLWENSKKGSKLRSLISPAWN